MAIWALPPLRTWRACASPGGPGKGMWSPYHNPVILRETSHVSPWVNVSCLSRPEPTLRGRGARRTAGGTISPPWAGRKRLTAA
jgi:hypothetical protein